MANNLNLAQYFGVIAPIAGLSHLISSIWPEPPTSANDDIPQVTTTSDATQEVTDVASVWDRPHTMKLTETELSPQYITIDQILTFTETSTYQAPTVTVFKPTTVTEASSYQAPTVTVFRPTTVTETRTSTIISIHTPSATSTSVSHSKSKGRWDVLLGSMLISLLLGVLLTHRTGLWIPQTPLDGDETTQDDDTSSEKDRHDQEDTEEPKYYPNTDALEFWTEKRAYVEVIAGAREHNGATIECLRTIFDKASHPLGQEKLAEEIAKYIRTHAVENDERARAIDCLSDDHTRAFNSAKRIARSHVARYPETSIQIIAQLLLRGSGPFVDNIVLRDWLNEIRDNASLIHKLSAHTFATCPDHLRDPAISVQRYPRSPSRSHRESSVDDADRGRNRMPKPPVPSRAPSVDKTFIRKEHQYHNTDNPSASSTELAPHRERLRKVIMELKSVGVEEAWIAHNLPAVHAAIKTTGAAHVAVDLVKKLYAETVLKPKLASFANQLGTVDISSDPNDAATTADSVLSTGTASSADGDVSEDAESSTLIPEIQIDDTDDYANKDTAEDPAEDTAENTIERTAEEATQARASIEPINHLSPEVPNYEESYRDQKFKSDSSSDSSSEPPSSPTPAPRPGWVESIRGRRVSFLDLGDTHKVGTEVGVPEHTAPVDEGDIGPSSSNTWEQHSIVIESNVEAGQGPATASELVEEGNDGRESVNKPGLVQMPNTMTDKEWSPDEHRVNPAAITTAYGDKMDAASNDVHETEPESPYTIDPELVDRMIVDEIETAPVVNHEHANLPATNISSAEDNHLRLASDGAISNPEQRQSFAETPVESSQPILFPHSFTPPSPGLRYDPSLHEGGAMEGLEATGRADEVQFFPPYSSVPQQSPEPPQQRDIATESVDLHKNDAPEPTAPLETPQSEPASRNQIPGMGLEEDLETGIPNLGFKAGCPPKPHVEVVKHDDVEEMFEDVLMPNGQTIEAFQNEGSEQKLLVEEISAFASAENPKAWGDIPVDYTATGSDEDEVASGNSAADQANSTLGPQLLDPPHDINDSTQEHRPKGGMDAEQFDPGAPNTGSLSTEPPSHNVLMQVVPDYTRPPPHSTSGQFTNPTSSSVYGTGFAHTGFSSISSISPSPPYVPLGFPATSAQIISILPTLGPYNSNAPTSSYINISPPPQPPNPAPPSISSYLGRDEGDSDAESDSEAPTQRKPIRKPVSRISKLKAQSIDTTQLLRPPPSRAPNTASDSEAETDILPAAVQSTHDSSTPKAKPHQPTKPTPTAQLEDDDSDLSDVDEAVLEDTQHDPLAKAAQAAEPPSGEREPPDHLARINDAQRRMSRARIAALKARENGEGGLLGWEGGVNCTKGSGGEGDGGDGGGDDGVVERVGEDEVLW